MNFKKSLKKFVSYFLLFVFLTQNTLVVMARDETKIENEKKVTDKTKAKDSSLDNLPAKAYILTNYKTGQILYECNADEQLAIASITKIMTILLVVEAIEDDENPLNSESIVEVSENAKPSQNESSIWLAQGEKIKVLDLLRAVIISSANDAARTLAEAIGGSEENFVTMMNKRAKELGMKNTYFTNSTGMDEKGSYSCARDVSIMAKELMKHSWITNYAKSKKEHFKHNNDVISDLDNTNKLLYTYKGCNGLKTGTESNAGKCLCATAQRNGIGLCAVSLGSAVDEDRWRNCTQLLDYGFNNFQPIRINKEKIESIKIKVTKGKKDAIDCYCKDSGEAYLVEKIKAGKIKEDIKVEENINAPIEKGQTVGKINFVDENGKNIYSEKILADEDVEKITFGYVFCRMFKSFFAGIGFYD